MTRTYDVIKNGQKEEDRPLRLSEIENLKSEEGKKYETPEVRASRIEQDTETAQRLYSGFQNYMREVHDCVTKNKPIEIEMALALIKETTESKNIIEGIYQLTNTFYHGKDYYITHPVNTMIYSLKMGLGMGYSREKLTELALTALLHDVGMFMIPENVIIKEGALTESELALIKRHPELGKNLLFKFKDQFPWLVRAVHEHQERENGQGYPRGIKGDSISEYAKIVGICDMYEAMTHNRPHKRSIMQFASVRELIETKNLWFPTKILRTFLEVLSLYPIGSYVKLNNSAIGLVIATNKDQPLKPIIKLLFDGNGEKVTEERIIDLKQNTVLNILSGVSEDELPS
ncbi:MAG TPA: HD domain-containing phosphohydrolase [Syntrophales bacterium]|nr:HD domain-containing phosphohydrolase [Syntrophales bacterium]